MARFAGLGAFAGFGLAHHLTTVLVIAPAGLALLVLAIVQRRLRPIVLVVALIGFAVPLLSYGTIWTVPGAHPANDDGETAGLLANRETHRISECGLLRAGHASAEPELNLQNRPAEWVAHYAVSAKPRRAGQAPPQQ